MWINSKAKNKFFCMFLPYAAILGLWINLAQLREVRVQTEHTFPSTTGLASGYKPLKLRRERKSRQNYEEQ